MPRNRALTLAQAPAASQPLLAATEKNLAMLPALFNNAVGTVVDFPMVKAIATVTV